MNSYSWGQLVAYFVVLLALVKPLAAFMARVYQGEHTLLERSIGRVERLVYRLAGVNPRGDMDWKTYAIAMLIFNGLGLFVESAFRVTHDELTGRDSHEGDFDSVAQLHATLRGTQSTLESLRLR